MKRLIVLLVFLLITGCAQKKDESVDDLIDRASESGAAWSSYPDQSTTAVGDTFLFRDLDDATAAKINEITAAQLATDLAGKISAGDLANDSIIDADIDDDGTFAFTGSWNFGGATLEIYNTNSGDQALTAEGQIGYKSDEDLIVLHGGTAGEGQGAHAFSTLQHIVIVMDPSWAYDQNATYRTVPIMTVGDDFPHGFTIVEWEVDYVEGDPTTELDADIMCDTTADYNPAADATVMDVIDTTAGASAADTGFDSATCANASKMYVRFGADPTDANVMITIDIWGYAEED